MKEYQYPDRGDRLTCRLIEGDYDGAYWEASERAVLEQMCAAIDHMDVSREQRTFCDVGCGMGRLFSVFAPHVGSVTAVEPDAERCAAAIEAAECLRPAAIRVLHGESGVLPRDARFRIVLASHVLQHIPQAACESLFADLAARLEDGGLLLLMTTCAPGEQDLFYRESWVDGERFSRQIDAETFETVFAENETLPVRMFAEKTIRTLAETNGLRLLHSGGYHYLGHRTAAEDAAANACGDTEGARDSYWIFQKTPQTAAEDMAALSIDANICYQFSFGILGDETSMRPQEETELRSAIREAYPDAIFEDDAAADNEPFFRDLRTVQDFLHGGGLPFENFRVLLKNYRLQMPAFRVTDSAVLLTIFPQSDTAQICVFLSVKEAQPDELVYLRHVQGNGAKLTNQDGRCVSVREIFSEVSRAIKRCVTDVEETYLLEIKRFDTYEDVDRILERHACMLYGMMCGDEGWRNVPRELAVQRLENRWGSRDFTKLLSFGANSIFFNLNQSQTARRYTENRARFDQSFYGNIDPYFLVDSSYAGVTHGVLLSMELVMVIKTICSRILRRQASYYAGRSSQISSDIRKTKAYRGQLLTTLNKIESLSISEVGELERVMLRSQQIEPIIDKVKYLLELLESELDLLYQNSTNRLVNILTVAGLILAVLQIVLA